LASRRRRRKTIGRVVSDVERRIRVVEKRPGAKRLKRNVVTAEKIQYRSIVAKNVATDGITPNEASFGTTLVTDTEPTEYLKEGTTWVDPDTGAAAVYDPATEAFVDLTAVDLTARASADGKNTIYRQTSQPTGGTYVTGDTWFDSDDNNKIYRYNGSTWVAVQLGGNGLANINANSITTGSIDASVITVSNLDAGNITTGLLSASRITTGTISASISITSATITGSTITGGTIQTASSGTRIVLASASSNVMSFYGSSTSPGQVSVNSHAMYFYPPASSQGASVGATMQLYGDQDSSTPNSVFMRGGSYNTFFMTQTAIALQNETSGYALKISSTLGAYAEGSFPETGARLRNIRIVTSGSAPTSGSSSAGYDNGTVVLVRES
jgi:hypothetical protein